MIHDEAHSKPSWRSFDEVFKFESVHFLSVNNDAL